MNISDKHIYVVLYMCTVKLQVKSKLTESDFLNLFQLLHILDKEYFNIGVK